MTLPRALQRALADAHRADRAPTTPPAVPVDLGRLLQVTATTPDPDGSPIRSTGGTDQREPPSHRQ
ncbi:MAG: hypothetical protein INR72_10830 [Williamsia herbipolensis]|nr:hypothetical protein [Williamsia herbipolensis]